MKIVIDTDERYPDYSYCECEVPWAVEVPAETVQRWRGAQERYAAVQEEMAAVLLQNTAKWKESNS